MIRKLKALDDSSSSEDFEYADEEEPDDDEMGSSQFNVMESLRNFRPPELLDFPEEEKKTQGASSSMQTKQALPQFSSNDPSNILSGSFNMDKIIQENNKKLNRFGYNNRENNEQFNDLIVEDLELDLPEVKNLEEMARKALGREPLNYTSMQQKFMRPGGQGNHIMKVDQN